MILPIVQTPNSVLTQKAKRVSQITKGVHSLINDMKNTLNATVDPIGVGLAAPQVGKSLQIFIMKPSEKSTIEVIINPKIEFIKENEKLQENKQTKKRRSSVKLEGCLSIQTIWGKVNRPSRVEMSYMDGEGNYHTKKITGFKATIAQHEYDHLQGILFTKRALEQKGKLYQSKKDKEGVDVFEEIEL